MGPCLPPLPLQVPHPSLPELKAYLVWVGSQLGCPPCCCQLPLQQPQQHTQRLWNEVESFVIALPANGFLVTSPGLHWFVFVVQASHSASLQQL